MEQSESMEELARKGKAQRQHRVEVKTRRSELESQRREQHARRMTSPLGRLILRTNQAGYILTLPVIFLVVVAGYFLEKSGTLDQLVHALKGYPILKGYDAESIVILILLISPCILLVLIYAALNLIEKMTNERYYLLEVKWLKTLPFITEGYWELLGNDSSSLKVLVVYKKNVPEEAGLADVAAGLGFDFQRRSGIVAEYFELEGEKLREAIDSTDKWKVTIDLFHVREPMASLANRSIHRFRTYRGVIYTREKLLRLINSCLIPLHSEFPIAGIKIAN